MDYRLDVNFILEMFMKSPLLFLNALFLFISLVESFKWPFPSSSTLATRKSGTRSSLDPSATELPISQLEKDTVFQSLDLIRTFKAGPDCFRDAVGQLNLRCEEMESSQDERVNAAISMALCEIQTTDHVPVPMECRPFSGGHPSTSQSTKDCVEALYRSPQLWSSYSGYLRQIPQICFAYRRWHDIDTAKRIYQNATMEKIALLQILKRRHDELHDQESRFFEGLDNLDSIGGNLKISVESFETKSGHILDGLRGSWQEVRREAVSLHDHLRGLINEQVSAHGDRLSIITRHVEAEHASALDSLLADTSHSLTLVRNTLSGLSAHAGSLSLITRDAEAEWPKLQAGVVTFTNALLSVNTAMEHVTAKMQSQADVVDEITSRQEYVSQQLSSLSHSITQISSVAKGHIEEMNATAIAIRHDLLGRTSRSALDWILPGLLHILPFVDRFEIGSFPETLSGPAAQLSLFALRLVWSLFSSVFSFLASSFLVFLSTRFIIRKSTEPKTTRTSKYDFLSGIFTATPPEPIVKISKIHQPSRVTFENTGSMPADPQYGTYGRSGSSLPIGAEASFSIKLGRLDYPLNAVRSFA